MKPEDLQKNHMPGQESISKESERRAIMTKSSPWKYGYPVLKATGINQSARAS